MQVEGRQPVREVLARAYRTARRAWHGLAGLPLVRHWRGAGLRRLTPLGGGRQRGTPIVRFYWERFLEAHRPDIRGRALEIGTDLTLRRLGGALVTHADVLDLARRDGVTVVADLTRADHLSGEQYDCMLMPFTAHHIFDIESALHHAIRLLKPGGVLLVNFPCLEYYPSSGIDMGTGRPLHIFWSFTPLHVENLLRSCGLQPQDFTLVTDGNLFARVAYQMNMTSEELTAEERTHRDAGHPLLISARIVRPPGWNPPRPAVREAWVPGGPPAVWNAVTGHYPRR